MSEIKVLGPFGPDDMRRHQNALIDHYDATLALYKRGWKDFTPEMVTLARKILRRALNQINVDIEARDRVTLYQLIKLHRLRLDYSDLLGRTAQREIGLERLQTCTSP